MSISLILRGVSKATRYAIKEYIEAQRLKHFKAGWRAASDGGDPDVAFAAYMSKRGAR